MITKIALRDIFNTFAENDPRINFWEYAVNHLWEVDKDLESDGVVQWVNSIQGTVSNNIARLNYQVFMMDLVNTKKDNSDEVESDTHTILLNLLSYLELHSQEVGKMFSLDKQSITIEPFREKFDSMYAGNILTLAINVPFNYNTCIIPTK